MTDGPALCHLHGSLPFAQLCCPLCSCLSCTGEHSSETAARWVSSVPSGRITWLGFLAMHCLMQPRRLLALFSTGALCLFMNSLNAHIFWQGAFQPVSLKAVLVLVLILQTGEWLAIQPFVDLLKVPVGRSLQHLRSLWNPASLSGLSTTFPNSVSPAKLLRVHSGPPSRSFRKMLNTVHIWGTTLHTGLQLDLVVLITTLCAHRFSSFQFTSLSLYPDHSSSGFFMRTFQEKHVIELSGSFLLLAVMCFTLGLIRLCYTSSLKTIFWDTEIRNYYFVI